MSSRSASATSTYRPLSQSALCNEILSQKTNSHNNQNLQQTDKKASQYIKNISVPVWTGNLRKIEKHTTTNNTWRHNSQGFSQADENLEYSVNFPYINTKEIDTKLCGVPYAIKI